MAKPKKPLLPEARLPKGMRDVEAAELRAMGQMLDTIRAVYDRYGFEPLETPAFEYTECLGKFLPDQDRPNAGVFSFQDEDEQWLSLRYDLTAPLARYVAEQGDRLAKPFRRYAVGPVWRNEKPGPGRYRQFTQFDADIVGTDNLTADAEICMLAADTLEALGLAGKFIIRVNNRKVLDGIIESVGIAADDTHTRLAVLRSLDKLDKFSREDVALLLGPGRKDESGDFTKGAGLSDSQVRGILAFVTDPQAAATANTSARYQDGMAELDRMGQLLRAAGYAEDRVKIDYSVVRGLEYYTGPVFEAELTFEVTGDDGQPVRFGSVGGGGRYDDLVARFTGQPMPATGFSIGVSRLYAALNAVGASRFAAPLGPVVVLVMDKKEPERYQAITQSLRHAGIRAEMYLGTAGMKPQMKYADRRGAPAVIIEGSDERAQGIITIKDLIEGARAAETIADRGTWTEERPAQFTVAFDQLIPAIRDLLARHQPKA